MTAPPYRPPTPETLRWAAQLAGEPIVRVDRLTGGTTADVDRLVDSLGRRLVLRRWTDPGRWTAGLVGREAAALTALEPTAVPAPRLVGTDPNGSVAGTRCLLMTELPGEVVLAPHDLDLWVRRLSEAQASIHALPMERSAALPRADGFLGAGTDVSWIPDPGLRRDVTAAAIHPSAGEDVFAHGDFQHFNVLWSGATVSGVVDWPNAGRGPRGIDVGHCLLNLAVLFSPDTADAYLRAYEIAAGVRVGTAGRVRGLLHFDPTWPEFIPVQVAGRARVEVDGMRDRVIETLRRTLARDS